MLNCHPALKIVNLIVVPRPGDESTSNDPDAKVALFLMFVKPMPSPLSAMANPLPLSQPPG